MDELPNVDIVIQSHPVKMAGRKLRAQWVWAGINMEDDKLYQLRNKIRRSGLITKTAHSNIEEFLAETLRVEIDREILNDILASGGIKP